VGSVKDPEGAEAVALEALGALADFDGKRVVEIGCGDGRMTWLYAERASKVLAIDTESESIAAARKATPPELASTVRFRVASAEKLRVRPAGFDIAFLSWSL
jgi:ubiquinone/menaquinone biosynthesis C-methylase UbiE